jgi:hypothetical protein
VPGGLNIDFRNYQSTTPYSEDLSKFCNSRMLKECNLKTFAPSEKCILGYGICRYFCKHLICECFSAILPDSAEQFNLFKGYLDNVQRGKSIFEDADVFKLHSSSILEL